jgi:hypothetical protein
LFNFKKVVSIIVIFSFVLGACSSKQIQREQEELEEQERAEAKRQEQLQREKEQPPEQSLTTPFTDQHPNINIPGVLESPPKKWIEKQTMNIKTLESKIDKEIKLLEHAEVEAEVETKTVELAEQWRAMAQTKELWKATDAVVYERINKASEYKNNAEGYRLVAEHRAAEAQKRAKGLLLLAEEGLTGGEVEPVGMRDNAQREAITEQYLAQKEKEIAQKFHELEIGWATVEVKWKGLLKSADKDNKSELLSPKRRKMNIKTLESLADKEIKLLEFAEEKAKEGVAEFELSRELRSVTVAEWQAGTHPLNKRFINARKRKNRAERVRELLLAMEAAVVGDMEPDVAQKEKEIAQKFHELAIKWDAVAKREMKTRDAWDELPLIDKIP